MTFSGADPALSLLAFNKSDLGNFLRMISLFNTRLIGAALLSSHVLSPYFKARGALALRRILYFEVELPSLLSFLSLSGMMMSPFVGIEVINFPIRILVVSVFPLAISESSGLFLTGDRYGLDFSTPFLPSLSLC